MNMPTALSAPVDISQSRIAKQAANKPISQAIEIMISFSTIFHLFSWIKGFLRTRKKSWKEVMHSMIVGHLEHDF